MKMIIHARSQTWKIIYSKEPKSGFTAFNLFTFFHTDLIQSEASQLETVLNFWLVNVCMKECELIEGGHTFGLLAVTAKLTQ